MDVKNLVKAFQTRDVYARIMNPERYVNYSLFRNCFPELYGGDMMPGGDADEKTALLCKMLAGENLDDNILMQYFAFTNAQLEAAMAEAEPVIKPIPEGLVLMTYDDATIDHYEKACPVLEQYGGRANLMVAEMEPSPRSKGFSDKSAYMTWQQIKELSDRGHEICNHSLHHRNDFSYGDDEQVLSEARGIEERCAEHGIPKPITFGYPLGRCTPRIEELLRSNGYLWGRGDLRQTHPAMLGQTLYEPHTDSPMVVPGAMITDEASIINALKGTVGGRIALTVYHDVNDKFFCPMPYEDQVKCIYDNGGRCVTFRELMEYIDPVKAYEYTHEAPELPERALPQP